MRVLITIYSTCALRSGKEGISEVVNGDQNCLEATGT